MFVGYITIAMTFFRQQMPLQRSPWCSSGDMPEVIQKNSVGQEEKEDEEEG